MTKAVLSHPVRPATTGNGRIIIWVRKNLFSSWSNSLLTLLCFWLMWELIPPLLNWAFLQANWVGTTRADCTKEGACWVFIHQRFGQFMYGLYPHDQRWRINLALLVGLLSILPMFWKGLPQRGRYIACWAVIYPLIVWLLLYGGVLAGARRNPPVGWPDADADYRLGGDSWRITIRYFAGAGTPFNHAGRAHPVGDFH